MASAVAVVLLWARTLSVAAAAAAAAAAGSGADVHDSQCCDCISAPSAHPPATGVRFAQAYGDEMVLQQGTPAHLYVPAQTLAVLAPQPCGAVI